MKALLVLFLGCAHYPSLRETPKYSIPVHVDADVPVDPLTVLSWVDLRADEWIAHKADWGCGGWTDDYLGFLVTSEPVIVHSGYFLPSSEPGMMGWNSYDAANPKITASINYPAWRAGYCPWDPAYVVQAPQDSFDYSYGLRELPHEWTHTARGGWHP